MSIRIRCKREGKKSSGEKGLGPDLVQKSSATNGFNNLSKCQFMRIRHLKVHCAMGEPAMPTQGVVTKNNFGNRSVDKGITQPTNNKFRFIELYAQKLDSV